MKKKLKMIDIFAGAGGLTKGFNQEGVQIIDTIEFDVNAVKTYNFNFNLNIIPRDITNSSVQQNFISSNKNKANILIGGFPCQGFSIAGLRDPEDPRNKLYLDTIKIIKGTNPEVFILENVKGLLSMEKGERISIIMKDLENTGYYCKYILLDSSNFGVSQKRERVIFIGSKMENKDKVILAINKLSNIKLKAKNNVCDAIGDLVNLKENIEFNHKFTNHSQEIVTKLSKLNEGDSLYNNYKDSWRRVFWLEPSPTVKENHGAPHVHPKLNRVMTVRELARLQSFPDDFIFKGPKSSQLRQVGNAVPVKMSNAIAQIIIETFFKENK